MKRTHQKSGIPTAAVALVAVGMKGHRGPAKLIMKSKLVKVIKPIKSAPAM